MLSSKVTEVKRGPEGLYAVIDDGSSLKKHNCDKILVAVGRKPNTGNLKIENTTIDCDPGGFIITDDYKRTSVNNIFAIGDIANTPVVKCISAVKMQMPVVVSNIVAAILGNQPLEKYDGTNNQVIMVSEREAVLFRCKFMRHMNLPFSYGLSGSQAIGRLSNLLSPISYWRYLLSAKSLRIPFLDS